MLSETRMPGGGSGSSSRKRRHDGQGVLQHMFANEKQRLELEEKRLAFAEAEAKLREAEELVGQTSTAAGSAVARTETQQLESEATVTVAAAKETSEPVSSHGVAKVQMGPFQLPDKSVNDVLDRNHTIPPALRVHGNTQRSFEAKTARQPTTESSGAVTASKGTRHSKILPKWKASRPWLQGKSVEMPNPNRDGPSVTTEVMVCTWCTAGNYDNVWAKEGCFRLQKQSIEKHERSADHQSAAVREKSRGGMAVAMHNAVLCSNERLMRLGIQAYTSAVCFDSMQTFPQRCTALEMLGLDVGQHYRTEKICRELLFHIASVIRDDLQAQVKSSPVFGHAIDEATDIATEQGLIQYVSFVHNGEARKAFYAMLSIGAQDAETIFRTDEASLAEAWGGDTNEMHKHHVSMGTDGCSAMTGKDNGVVAKWKKLNPRIQDVHCVAHRLALAPGDAESEVSEIEEVIAMIHDHYNHFARSVKRRKAFNAAQKWLGLKEGVLKRDVATRWLSKGFQRSMGARVIGCLSL